MVATMECEDITLPTNQPTVVVAMCGGCSFAAAERTREACSSGATATANG